MTIDVTPAATCAEPNFGDRRNFWSGTLTVRPLIGFEGTPVERIIGHGHQLGGTLLPNNRFSIGEVVDFKILEIYATTDGDLQFNLSKPLSTRHTARAPAARLRRGLRLQRWHHHRIEPSTNGAEASTGRATGPARCT